MSILILLISVLATAFISGVFGMAGGLILMGVLALILPVSAAMVVHGAIQSVSNGWRALLLSRWIAWRVLLIYLGGSASAALALALMTVQLDTGWLFVVLGLTPAIIWVPKSLLHLDAEKPAHALACGFTVTALNTIAGVSGPLLDVFFAETRRDRRTIVATKAATQVVSHAVKIAYYILPAISIGALPQTEWLLLALPLSIIGTTLGAQVLERMSDILFRQWTKYIVSAIGILYVGRGAVLLTGS